MKNNYLKKVDIFYNNIPAEFTTLLRETYPKVDVSKCLRESKMWLHIHHEKRRKKDFQKFINNWCKSDQRYQERRELKRKMRFQR